MLILKHESIIHLKQVANKLLLFFYFLIVTRYSYTELLFCKNSHFVKYMYMYFVLHVRKQLLDFRCFFVLRF